jgi:HEAT repeat protein
VNIKKTSILLISILTLFAVLVAFNFERLGGLFSRSTSPEVNSEDSQPRPGEEAKSNAITQLMQQDSAPLPADSPISQAVDDAPSSDDIQTLEEALSDFYSSEDEQDRETALMILGEYPDPKAREAILYALNDPEDIVREQAVSQISNWEDEKERQQMLLTALNNDKSEIVVLALESVDTLEDPALIQKIKELSGHKDEDISEAAKTALEMMDSN